MGAYSFQPLRCLIIDDERPAQQVLKLHIEKIDWLHLVGELDNAIDALVKIPLVSPDIIFLDIEMPHLNGLQLLDMLRLRNNHVVLTSAYSAFAVEGYDYDVASFLLKPITFDSFLKTVNKIRLARIPVDGRDSQNIQSVPDKIESIQPILAGMEADMTKADQPAAAPVFVATDTLWATAEKIIHQISFDKIQFIEADKNYVKVYYEPSHQLLLRTSLTSLESQLPPNFVRTHKSYIVNRKAIKEINGNTIWLHNGHKASISTKERNDILRLLTNQR